MEPPGFTPGSDVRSEINGRPRCLQFLKSQQLLFLVVGGFNTLIGFIWFTVFETFVGGVVGYMVSLLLAHIFSVLSSFLTNRYFVFKVRGHFWADLGRFEIVQLAMLSINLVALPVAVEIVGLKPIVAQALITVITVFVTWFAYKYFSFRRRNSIIETPE